MRSANLPLKYTLLTLIFLLAAAGRVLHIDDQSFWIDEGTTYYNLMQPDLVYSLATGDHHPPLYYLLLKGWMALAGSSVFSLRFFSVIPSLLSVALVYALARAMQRGERLPGVWVPALAALFVALSDVEIVLAQEVRMYTLRTLFVLLSMWGYVRWVQTPQRRWAALWVVSNVLLFHTQYMGLYIPVFQGAHALLFLRGGQRIKAVVYLAVAGLMFAPWFLLYGFDQRLNDTGLYAGMPSTPRSLQELRDKFLTEQWPLTVALLLLGSFTITGTAPRVQLRRAGWVFLLWFWLLFTVIVTYVGNFWYHILSPRRIMFIVPALAILFGQGLNNIRGWVLPFLTAVIVVYGVTTVDDYYPKPPWDEVGADMARYAEPGELAIMEIYRGDFPLGYYIDQWMPDDTEVISMRRLREDHPGSYQRRAQEVIDRHSVAWVAFWDPDETIFRLLQESGYERTATLPTPHIGSEVINVYRYERLQPGPADVPFVNGMVLEQAEIIDGGERVDLWWRADETLNDDYSVSVFLLDEAGQLAAQHDSYPLENRQPTTAWQPGALVYDPHPLDVSSLAPGTYSVGVKVYTWYDGQPRATATGDEWATVGEVRVE